MIVKQPPTLLVLTDEDLHAAVQLYLAAKNLAYKVGNITLIDMHHGRLLGGEEFYSGTITFELEKKD